MIITKISFLLFRGTGFNRLTIHNLVEKIREAQLAELR